MSFYVLQVSFQQIYYLLAQRLDSLFWTKLKGMTFAVAEEQMGHLESTDVLCLHRTKTLIASCVRYESFCGNASSVCTVS